MVPMHAWPNSKAYLECFRLTDANIKQQYKSLLDNNKYSDLAIQTNDGVCYVHKVLLVLFDDALVDGVCAVTFVALVAVVAVSVVIVICVNPF